MTIFGRYNPKLGSKTYGFCLPRAMGYGLQIPAHQLDGTKGVWDFRGYGLLGAWVKRVSTVSRINSDPDAYRNGLEKWPNSDPMRTENVKNFAKHRSYLSTENLGQY